MRGLQKPQEFLASRAGPAGLLPLTNCFRKVTEKQDPESLSLQDGRREKGQEWPREGQTRH